jgi:hypothetical protein
VIKCGCCGSSYTSAGRDKRGYYLRCSRQSEKGTCDNRRTIAVAMIEGKVLEAIETRLAAPDLIAAYVRDIIAWRAPQPPMPARGEPSLCGS